MQSLLPWQQFRSCRHKIAPIPGPGKPCIIQTRYINTLQCTPGGKTNGMKSWESMKVRLYQESASIQYLLAQYCCFSSISAPVSASASCSSQNTTHQQKGKQQTHRHHIVKNQNCISQMTSIGSSIALPPPPREKASRRRRRPANSRVVAAMWGSKQFTQSSIVNSAYNLNQRKLLTYI
jgi:hypothetical protein